MSENPAHAHRRALSPPAVTRFQLITPAASEAVFAPPYVPARSERLRYTRKPPQPVTYTQFPEPLARPPSVPPLPPAPPEPEPQPAREAPATWRELIARVEADRMAEPERQEAPAERLEPAEATAETIESAEPRELESDVAPIPGAGWELEALTTDAYTAPRVEEPVDEIAELLLDDVVGAAAAAAEPRLEEVVTGGRDDFPLDAFIVPAGTTPPRGYDSDVAHMVAHRLDELARQLRSDGLSALGSTTSIDELSRVLAAIVTGYIAHHA